MKRVMDAVQYTPNVCEASTSDQVFNSLGIDEASLPTQKEAISDMGEAIMRMMTRRRLALYQISGQGSEVRRLPEQVSGEISKRSRGKHVFILTPVLIQSAQGGSIRLFAELGKWTIQISLMLHRNSVHTVLQIFQQHDFRVNNVMHIHARDEGGNSTVRITKVFLVTNKLAVQ